MGKLSIAKFNQDLLPDVIVIVGGNTPVATEDAIVSKYNIVSRVEKIFHYYELSYDQKNVGLVFGVYGAAMVIDLLHYLKDGACKKVVFIGYAFSRDVEWINKLVLVQEALSVDGVTGDSRNPATYYPMQSLYAEVKSILVQGEHNFAEDKVSSGSSVFYKDDQARVLMQEHSHLVDMEVGSVFFTANMLSLSAAALLLVNETNEVKIHHSSGAKEQFLPNVVASLLTHYLA